MNAQTQTTDASTAEAPGRLPRLIVETHVRQFALDYAAQKKKLSSGQPRFVRIDPEWFDRIEAQFKAHLRAYIDRLPSHGRTIQ